MENSCFNWFKKNSNSDNRDLSWFCLSFLAVDSRFKALKDEYFVSLFITSLVTNLLQLKATIKIGIINKVFKLLTSTFERLRNWSQSSQAREFHSYVLSEQYLKVSPSNGSSCLITNVLLHYGWTNCYCGNKWGFSLRFCCVSVAVHSTQI